MIRFTTISEKLKAALCDFCFEQMPYYEDYSEEDIMALLDIAFKELEKIPCGVFDNRYIQRYCISGNISKELLNGDESMNGVLYDNAIYLARFENPLDSSGFNACKSISHGYDVVYDLYTGTIRLLYRIDISDSDIATTYRVESDYFEDFNTIRFVIALTAQLADKLRANVEHYGRICELCS